MTKRTRTVEAIELEQDCLRLLEEVRTTGVRILVTKLGEPIAQVEPFEGEQGVRQWPELAEQGTMNDDLVSPAAELATAYGGHAAFREDPLLADDAVWEGPTATDLADAHDSLYDDEPS